MWPEVATLGAGQAIAILGAVAGIRLLTERLAPADYGDVTLSLTVAALLNLLGSGPIANAVSRFYSVSQQRGTLRCFFGSGEHALCPVPFGSVRVRSLLPGSLLRQAGACWADQPRPIHHRFVDD